MELALKCALRVGSAADFPNRTEHEVPQVTVRSYYKVTLRLKQATPLA